MYDKSPAASSKIDIDSGMGTVPAFHAGYSAFRLNLIGTRS